MATNTAQIVYLFTSDGQCATIPVHQLPEIHEASEGATFTSLVPLPSTTDITAAISLPETLEHGYLMFSTANGEIKRLRIEDDFDVDRRRFAVLQLVIGDGDEKRARPFVGLNRAMARHPRLDALPILGDFRGRDALRFELQPVLLELMVADERRRSVFGVSRAEQEQQSSG